MVCLALECILKSSTCWLPRGLFPNPRHCPCARQRWSEISPLPPPHQKAVSGAETQRGGGAALRSRSFSPKALPKGWETVHAPLATIETQCIERTSTPVHGCWRGAAQLHTLLREVWRRFVYFFIFFSVFCFWRLWRRTPSTPLIFQLDPGEVVVTVSTFTDARALKRTKKKKKINKCTKTLLSVTLNGCITAGGSHRFVLVTRGGQEGGWTSLLLFLRFGANTKTPIAGLVPAVNGHLQCSITNTPPGTLREDWMNFNVKLWCYEPAVEHVGKQKGGSDYKS